ncbi:MAG TPA: hypothetical protein VJR23_16510 [Candidatus Acidoferrales bacterium]|nr:hypothetical protein [Candidatus Acidoferrales bacterium]
MADWRQIQARIRKAKNAPDAHAKLSELYQRTRDAMVAWELGLLEEKTLVQAEAVKWYTIAAQRFRRADWKKKAEEALSRLGAEIPAAGSAPALNAEDSVNPSDHPSDEPSSHAPDSPEKTSHLAPGEIPEGEDGQDESAASEAVATTAAAATGAPGDPAKRKRRRGRRGGRGRHRKAGAGAAGLPSQAFVDTSAGTRAPHTSHSQSESHADSRTESRHDSKPPAGRSTLQLPEPQLPSERMAHGRAGDPALASRMALLESRLRRLLSSPLHKLSDADEAPAGPGVFLLSDSDQITSYYVEACQTLRIGLSNLLRGGRGGKSGRGGHGYGDSALKSKLAEHLEINEAKVAQYLKDHCVVRWIQLDEEAPILAHFAISVLRTPLNLD